MNIAISMCGGVMDLSFYIDDIAMAGRAFCKLIWGMSSRGEVVTTTTVCAVWVCPRGGCGIAEHDAVCINRWIEGMGFVQTPIAMAIGTAA